MTYQQVINEAATRFKCPYCMSLPGVWCRTKSGEMANWLHGQRTEPFRMVYMAGYEEGETEGRDIEVRRAKRAAERAVSV